MSEWMGKMGISEALGPNIGLVDGCFSEGNEDPIYIIYSQLWTAGTSP